MTSTFVGPKKFCVNSLVNGNDIHSLPAIRRATHRMFSSSLLFHRHKDNLQHGGVSSTSTMPLLRGGAPSFVPSSKISVVPIAKSGIC